MPFNPPASNTQTGNGSNMYALAGSGGGGVTSLNTKDGAVTLVPDTSIVISSGGPSTISFSTAGTIQNVASLTASGAVSGATVTASGAVSGATVTASGAVSGASVTASGTVQGATVISTGTVQAVTADISGVAVIGGLEAGSVVTGSFTGVLGVGGSVTLLQVAQPCYVEVFCNANPSTGQGDPRYAYIGLLITASATGGNLFLGATNSGLPVSPSGCVINAVNGSAGTPTAYGTPVDINLGSLGGGGASQSWAGSYRVMALPNVKATYVGAIPTTLINYVIP